MPGHGATGVRSTYIPVKFGGRQHRLARSVSSATGRTPFRCFLSHELLRHRHRPLYHGRGYRHRDNAGNRTRPPTACYVLRTKVGVRCGSLVISPQCHSRLGRRRFKRPQLLHCTNCTYRLCNSTSARHVDQLGPECHRRSMNVACSCQSSWFAAATARNPLHCQHQYLTTGSEVIYAGIGYQISCEVAHGLSANAPKMSFPCVYLRAFVDVPIHRWTKVVMVWVCLGVVGSILSSLFVCAIRNLWSPTARCHPRIPLYMAGGAISITTDFKIKKAEP